MEGLNNPYATHPELVPRMKAPEYDGRELAKTKEGLIQNYDILAPEADRLMASDSPEDQAKGLELRGLLGFHPDSHLGDGK